MITPPLPPTRHCTVCHRDLPLDAEHFHRHVRHRDGFREVCKECRSRNRKSARLERYGKAEKSLLLKFGQNVRAGRDSPQHGQILYVLCQYFGGAAGIGAAMAAQFDAARPGCRQRLSILDTITALTVANGRREEARAAKCNAAMRGMSKVELEQDFLRTMQELLDKFGLAVVEKTRLGTCTTVPLDSVSAFVCSTVAKRNSNPGETLPASQSA